MPFVTVAAAVFNQNSRQRLLEIDEFVQFVNKGEVIHNFLLAFPLQIQKPRPRIGNSRNAFADFSSEGTSLALCEEEQ